MDNEYDKIRILWIDDCEGQDIDYMYPEKILPTKELQQYFKIVKHSDIPGPSTIRTPQDFGTCFNPFWWGDGNTDIFPPEIIAMDYVLEKWSDKKVFATKRRKEPPPYLKSGASKPNPVLNESNQSWENDGKETSFEGLILGIFTSSILHQHPIGIVPMTNYGDLLEDVSGVHALHLISKEVLHIDYSEFGVSGKDRSWKNVLEKGVKALRVRIEGLYETWNIVLSPSDLMALAKRDKNHDTLMVRSSHVMRRLPVQGLFIDIPGEDRDEAIREWAKDLMRTVMVDCEELKQAQELANQVWNAYKNNELVEDRKNLSLLSFRKESGQVFDEKEYKRLCDAFGVTKKKVKSGYVDITSSGNYSNRVRRWAALLITLNMLKKLILIKKCIETHVHKTAGILPGILDGPVLTADDLFLALFPVPKGAIIVPWHRGQNLSNSELTWPSALLGWKTKDYIGKRRKANLALSIYDLLDGNGWKKEGPYGLKESERLVLRGFALEDSDLTETDWRTSNRANLVLWGNQQETE